MRKGFVVYTLAVLGLYAMASWWGWSFPSGKRGLMPPDARQPGGYRSFSYWRGGK